MSNICFLILLFLSFFLKKGKSDYQIQLSPSDYWVSSITNYSLNLFPDTSYPILANISVDFSSSDITMNNSNLITCQNNSLIYNGCYCDNKICLLPVNANVTAGSFFKITFGNLKNPISVKDQNSISVILNFNSTTTSPIKKTITASGYLPNAIYSQSLIQDSFKRAAKNNYTFYFNIKNDIVQNGKIILTFPSDLSDTSLSYLKQVYWKSYTDSIENEVSFTNSSLTITLSNLFSSSALTANSSGTLMIRIDSIQNPSILTNTSSIKIQTTDSSGYIINEVSTGLIIQVSVPGDIGILAIGPVIAYPTQINKETSFFIKLQPEVIYPRNGSLEIDFPPQFSFNDSQFSCQMFGLSFYEGTSGYCSRKGYSIFTNNTFYSSLTNQIIIVVHGVINPNSTAQTSTFYFQTYDESQKIICKSYTSFTYVADPGDLILSYAPKRNEVLAGKNFILEINFTIMDNFAANGFISVEIPIEQAILNNSVECKVFKNNNYESQTCQSLNKTNSAQIWINEWCTDSTHSVCNNGTTLIFQIVSGLINPYFLSQYELPSLTLTTFANDKIVMYDRKNSSLVISPNPQPIPINLIKYMRLFSNDTGQLNTYDINIEINNYFYDNSGSVQVFFPVNAAFSLILQPILCFLVSSTNTEIARICNYSIYTSSVNTNSINYVQILDVCNSKSCETLKILLRIKNIRNPLSVKPLEAINNTNFYGAQFLTLDNKIIAFSTSSNIGGVGCVPSPFGNLIVNLSDSTTNKFTTLTINFQTYIEIPESGSFFLSFPNEYQTNNQTNCLILINETVNSSFSCALTNNNCSISFISNGLDFFFNTQIKITLEKILNPRSVKPSNNFSLSSRTSDLYDIQKNQFNITLQNISEIESIQIRRNNIFLNNETIINLQFTSLTDLFSNDTFQIYFSKDQINSNDTSALKVESLNSNSPTYINFTLIENNLTYFGLKFSDTNCQPCIANKISFNFYGFSNIGTTKLPINSNYLLVNDAYGYSIEEKKLGLFVQPNLASGNLTINWINLTNKTTGSDTDILISLNTENSVANGSILLAFPTEFFFVSNKNYEKTCEIHSKIALNCSLNLINGSNFGEFVAYIMIFNVEIDSQFSLEMNITNTLKNKPSNQPIATIDKNIQILTLDSNNNTIDSGYIDSNNCLPQFLNNFDHLNFTRESSIVFSQTNLFINFQNLNRLSRNSLFSIYLPISQITVTNSTDCSAFYSNKYQNVFCNLSNDSTYQIISFKEYCVQNDSQNTYCKEGSIFSYEISNLINNYCISDGNQYTIKIKSCDENNIYCYEEKSSGLKFNLDLEMSVFKNFSIELNQSFIAFPVQITLKFTLPSFIPNEGFISVSFPGSVFQFLENNCIFFIGDEKQKTCSISAKEGNFNSQEISSIILIDVCQNNSNIECVSGREVQIIFLARNQLYYSINFEKNNFMIIQSFTKDSKNISFYEYNVSNLILNSYILDKNFWVFRDNSKLNSSCSFRMDLTLPSILIYNSTFKILLPKNQIKINLDIFEIAIVSPIQKNLSNYEVSDDANYYYLLLNQSFCNNFCEENTNISIKLLNVSNPNATIYSKYNKFFISTYYETENQFISASQNGVYATPELYTSMLLNISISRNNALLNENIDLLIDFLIPNENGRSLINNSFLIEFPENFLYLPSSVEVPEVFIGNNNVSFLNLTNQTNLNKVSDKYGQYYIQTIRVDDICNNAVCSLNEKTIVKISKVKNPIVFFSLLNAMDLMIFFLSQNSYILNQNAYNSANIKPLIENLEILITSLARNTSQPSTYSNIFIDFSLASYIIPSSSIYISIPKKQLIFNANPECINKINNFSIECVLNSNISHFFITFKEFCSSDISNCSSASKRFEIYIKGGINPSKSPEKNQSNSIFIQAFTNYSDIYQTTKKNYFISPDIFKFYLDSIKITRSSNVAGSNAEYKFEIFLPQAIPNDAIFLVSFPEYLAYNPSNIDNLNCQKEYECNSMLSNENEGFITKLFIKNACSSTCNANTTISLSFTVKNQGNTYDYQTNQNFSVIIETSDESTDIARGDIKASTLQPITPGKIALIDLISNNYTVGQNMSLNIAFIISNDFLNQENSGKIYLNIPMEIDVLKNCSCSVYINSFGDGLCTVENNVLILTHNFNNSSKLNGSKLNVTLNGIVNPYSKKPSSSFTIISYGKINEKSVIFDQILDGIIYQPIYSGLIYSINISRNSSELGAEIILSAMFVTSTKNSNDGMILINLINSNEIEISTKYLLTCLNNIDYSTLNCTNYNGNILISNLSSYTANKIWNITINGLKNMYYVDEFINNGYSLLIETKTSDNFTIDSNIGKLHVEPSLRAGLINISNITRSSNVIADETSFQLGLNITNPVYKNNSFLKMSFPFEFLMISKLYNLVCFINEISLPCIYNLYWDKFSIRDISILDLSKLNSAQFYSTNIISGVRNMFFVSPKSYEIKFQTYIIVPNANDNGILDQTTINSLDFLPELQKKYIIDASINCLICSTNEISDLIIRFSLSHIVLNNVYIKIYIPEDISSFGNFTQNDKKCKGLLGLSSNISCFLQNNYLWISDEFSTPIYPGLCVLQISKIKMPSKAMNYSGFNFSVYYNETFLMDSSNTDIALQINSKDNSFICDAYCQTCTENNSECLSCFVPSYYPFFDPSQKKCLQKCPDGTFETSFYTCEKCFDTCEKCTGPSESDCESCKLGYVFSDKSCLPKCPDNTTLSNNSICFNDSCFGNCELCGLNKSLCITCKEGSFYDNQTGLCLNNSKCSGSYYLQSNICKECSPECLTCENNASNCTSCVDYYNKNSLLISEEKGTCLNQCPSHYYEEKQIITSLFPPYLSSIFYKCEKCDDNCLECKNSSKDSCISCNISNNVFHYLEYGVCVSNCSENNILINNTICKMNCSEESLCYKCSSENSSQCVECFSSNEFIINDQCTSQNEVCNSSHKYVSSLNPPSCSECDAKCKTCIDSATNCLSCFINEENGTNTFSFLYNQQCVYQCPAGYSPDYADSKICKDFVCEKPCSKCGFNSTFCFECDSSLPYLYTNKCFNQCPDQTIYDENSKQCISKNEPIPKLWATWLILSIFVIVLFYFIASYFFSKTTVTISSSLICLTQIVEFFSKIFAFGFLFNFKELAAAIFAFLNIVNNLVISMIFQTLYIGVFEVHIKSFSLFKSKNKNFYYFVFFGMLLFGINFTFAFSSGLFKFVRSEFENNFSYSKGLDRMVILGLMFAIMQIGVDCYILAKYDEEYDIFHLAYINLIANFVIYFSWAWKKGLSLKTQKLNKNS